MPETITKGTWTKVAFGDVIQLSKERSKDPEADGLQRYIGLEHIEPGDLRIRSWGHISDGTTFTNVFHPGQVLFGKRRAYQRKVAVADFSGVCSGDIYVLEPKNSIVLPELLPFICQTDAFFEHAIATSAGSLSPRTNWKSLSEYEFALPPLEEQRRIVEVIGACTEAASQLHKAADLGRTLLVSCIEARLSEICEICSIGNLVDEEALESPQDGNHGEIHPKASDYVESGIPFVMAADIRNGTVNLADCKCISVSQAKSLRVGFAQEGDVLLTHKGTLGETAIVPASEYPFLMLTPQVTYYRVLDRSRLRADYLYYVFQSRRFQRQLQSRGRQSTRNFIGITAQLQLTVPCPSINQQNAMVQEWRAIQKAARASESRGRSTAGLRRALTRKALPQGES